VEVLSGRGHQPERPRPRRAWGAGYIGGQGPDQASFRADHPPERRGRRWRRGWGVPGARPEPRRSRSGGVTGRAAWAPEERRLARTW